MGPLFSCCLALAAFLFLRTKPWYFGRRAANLPPGPPTTFLLGNVLQFPRTFPYLRFSQWAKEYGEIFSLKVLDHTIVVLTSAVAIRDILDKNGSITGDRPSLHMLLEADGPTLLNQNIGTHIWKTGRKAVRDFLTRDMLEGFWPAQHAEYTQMLNDILDSPEKVHTHLKRAVVSVVSTLVYGKRLPKYEGTEAESFFKGVQLFNEVIDPTAHPPVDFIPILKYVPARWAAWKDLCLRTKQFRGALYDGLFAEVEAKLAMGHHTNSYLERVLHAVEKQQVDMSMDEVKALIKVLIDAGAETSTSFVASFLLCILNYPECQVQAQAELDRVVGSARFPTIDDFPNLPYLNALIKEVHRFRPVAPVGFAHVASQDIQYKGYTIPTGSVIMTNLWGIYRDPNFFDNPESFDPDRYLKSEFGTRTDTHVDTTGFRDTLPFGSGRRLCPGAEFGTNTIALTAMNLLWAFSFAKDDSSTGGIELDDYHKPGNLLSPIPFTCRVLARDDRRIQLIRGS